MLWNTGGRPADEKRKDTTDENSLGHKRVCMQNTFEPQGQLQLTRGGVNAFHVSVPQIESVDLEGTIPSTWFEEGGERLSEQTFCVAHRLVLRLRLSNSDNLLMMILLHKIYL